MNIVLANRQRTRKINLRLLKQIAGALLADLKIEDAELGIQSGRRAGNDLLNETFLRHEGPTDVITFDYSDPDREPRTRDPDASLRGEIFICVERGGFAGAQI